VLLHVVVPSPSGAHRPAGRMRGFCGRYFFV
jgi:hypothetical protein